MVEYDNSALLLLVLRSLADKVLDDTLVRLEQMKRFRRGRACNETGVSDK